MKSSGKYLTKDQLFIDDVFSQVNEWSRVGKALDLVDICTGFSDNSWEAFFPFHDRIETYTEISSKDLYRPIKDIYFAAEVRYAGCSIQPYYDELKIQLSEFSRKLEKARIRNWQTRTVLSQINSELQKYEASGNKKHLFQAANVLLQFKKVQSKVLNFKRRQLRHLARCLLSRVSRDLRQVFRCLIRFLFKNMDADKDDIEALFKNNLNQIFFIKKIRRLYEYTGNNSIFEFFDRNRSNPECTNKGRAVRNSRKVKKPSFPGRIVSAHFTTRFAFGN